MITVLWDKTYNELVKELNELRDFKETVHEEQREIQSTCDVFFDFNDPDIKVYSIERVPVRGNEREHTLICWNDKEGKHHNWYCWCSHARHDQLVADFRKSKEKSKK